MMLFMPKLTELEDFKFHYRGRKGNYYLKPVFRKGKKFILPEGSIPKEMLPLFAEAILSGETICMNLFGPLRRQSYYGCFAVKKGKGFVILSSMLINAKQMEASAFEIIEAKL